MDITARKTVLVIVPTWKGNTDMLPAALRAVESARKADKLPISLALNRELNNLTAEAVNEMRELERRLIVGKSVDEVVFVDTLTSELNDLVRLARQYCLYPKETVQQNAA